MQNNSLLPRDLKQKLHTDWEAEYGDINKAPWDMTLRGQDLVTEWGRRGYPTDVPPLLTAELERVMRSPDNIAAAERVFGAIDSGIYEAEKVVPFNRRRPKSPKDKK